MTYVEGRTIQGTLTKYNVDPMVDDYQASDDDGSVQDNEKAPQPRPLTRSTISPSEVPLEHLPQPLPSHRDAAERVRWARSSARSAETYVMHAV